MLTEEQIADNKKRFIDIVSQIKLETVNVPQLLQYLEGTDFYTAPASTQYHCGYKGGLCQHSLNVYYALTQLANTFTPNMYSVDSLILVGLFHDLSKTNFYEPYVMNKKIYGPQGTKHDNLGTFDWIAEEHFKVKDAKERFLAGTHEENSFILLSQFAGLSIEEISAILWHHGGVGNGANVGPDLTGVYNRYPLATLLHMADMTATYILEREDA